MGETPVEETIREVLRAYAASEPFVVAPQQPVARAKRRIARTAAATIVVTLGLLASILVSVTTLRGPTETAPADATSFIPGVPTTGCCMPTRESLIFLGADRSVRYVNVPITDIDTPKSIPMNDTTPLAVTPDGSALLVATHNGPIGVYGGTIDYVEVSKVPRGLEGGAISPDGNTVVLAADGGLFQDSTQEGTQMRVLLPSDRGSSFSLPVWSPDGTRIAYIRTSAGNSALELLDVATGRSTKLLEDVAFGTWSPDGSRLAVLRPALGTVGETVFITDLSGSATQISLTPATGHPAWSPDGKRLAFATSDTEMAIVAADGSHEKRFQFPPIAAGAPVLLWVPGSTGG